jgi:hypothetical protein
MLKVTVDVLIDEPTKMAASAALRRASLSSTLDGQKLRHSRDRGRRGRRTRPLDSDHLAACSSSICGGCSGKPISNLPDFFAKVAS